MDSASGRFLALARRGKPGGWRYFAAIAAGIALACLAGLVLGLILTLTHVIGPQTAQHLSDPSHPVPFYLGIGASFALLLLGVWACARWILAKRLSDITGPWRWSLTITGFAVWSAMVGLGLLADFMMRPGGFHFAADGQFLRVVAIAVPALAVQTFTEEFLFRGVVTQGLMTVFRRPLVACVVSGVIFGAVHIANGIPQAATATVFGVVLAILAIETGGLALPWGLHLANNLFSGIVVISAGDVFKGAPGLIRQDTPGLDGFDVAFNVAALLVCAALILRYGPAARDQRIARRMQLTD